MEKALSAARERCDEPAPPTWATTFSDARTTAVAFTGTKPSPDVEGWALLVLLLAGGTVAVQGPAAGRVPRLDRRGLGALLAGLPHHLHDGEKNLGAAEARAVAGDAIAWLVAAALTRSIAGTGGLVSGCPASAAGGRWPALCASIEARLRDPALCPDDVAHSNGISTRHLHRLFQQAGTSFGTFVRDQRLARCRADLADPRCVGLSVTAIAFRWGFSDSAHFSRSFKAAYGVTARAFRYERLSASAAARPKLSRSETRVI
ncbi:MAG: helix-turn-helix transcriptional regulator [Rhodospirillales bacterium]|nr:helix-turn-helix transcriptional regulator [Rhodospirillales bacterium]